MAGEDQTNIVAHLASRSHKHANHHGQHVTGDHSRFFLFKVVIPESNILLVHDSKTGISNPKAMNRCLI
jgi:hypothetical protein